MSTNDRKAKAQAAARARARARTATPACGLARPGPKGEAPGATIMMETGAYWGPRVGVSGSFTRSQSSPR